MRYPADQREKTSERILRSAGRLFRGRGYAATGIDAVMSSAQLTAGAFYSHFRSKEDLLAETMDAIFRESGDDRPPELTALQGHEWLRAFAKFYLSTGHRNSAECGCPIPALAAEVARVGGRTRDVFEQNLRRVIDFIAKQYDAEHPDRKRAISTMSMFVGSVLLSRAVGDESLSQEILKTCRESAIDSIELSAASATRAEPLE
jgi:TetR/AcrR family transcriptional repressor of nem operon